MRIRRTQVVALFVLAITGATMAMWGSEQRLRRGELSWLRTKADLGAIGFDDSPVVKFTLRNAGSSEVGLRLGDKSCGCLGIALEHNGQAHSIDTQGKLAVLPAGESGVVSVTIAPSSDTVGRFAHEVRLIIEHGGRLRWDTLFISGARQPDGQPVILPRRTWLGSVDVGERIRANVQFDAFTLDGKLKIVAVEDGWVANILSMQDEQLEIMLAGPPQQDLGSQTIAIGFRFSTGEQQVYVDYYVDARNRSASGAEEDQQSFSPRSSVPH